MVQLQLESATRIRKDTGWKCCLNTVYQPRNVGLICLSILYVI
jgi:hypothetical protein